MKALQIKRYGDPQKELNITDIPEPGVVHANEVKLRVIASSMNFSDLGYIKGVYGNVGHVAGFPLTVGCEGVGVIVEKGAGVGDFEVGERVSYWCLSGGWAEYVVVVEDNIEKVSAEIDDGTAAQLMINPLTAAAMLEMARPGPGEHILLTAGSSNLARLIIVLAASKGFKPIVVVSKGMDTQALLAAGAVAVIDHSRESVFHRVRQLTEGKGVSVVYDAVAGNLASEVLPCLQYGGTMVLYGVLSNQRIPLSVPTVIGRDLTLQSFQLHRWIHCYMTRDPEGFKAFKREVSRFINALGIHLPVDRSFYYPEVGEALSVLKQRGRKGKVILTF